jgi:hypothetical protein
MPKPGTANTLHVFDELTLKNVARFATTGDGTSKDMQPPDIWNPTGDTHTTKKWREDGDQKTTILFFIAAYDFRAPMKSILSALTHYIKPWYRCRQLHIQSMWTMLLWDHETALLMSYFPARDTS